MMALKAYAVQWIAKKVTSSEDKTWDLKGPHSGVLLSELT